MAALAWAGSGRWRDTGRRQASHNAGGSRLQMCAGGGVRSNGVAALVVVLLVGVRVEAGGSSRVVAALAVSPWRGTGVGSSEWGGL